MLSSTASQTCRTSSTRQGAMRHLPSLPPACRESSVGVHKALSAAEACRALNSSIQVETHLEGLSPANAGAL